MKIYGPLDGPWDLALAIIAVGAAIGLLATQIRRAAEHPPVCNCREAMCLHIGGSLGPSETADLLMMTRKP